MKFTPTPEMISAAETVFLAKAHLALVAPIVTAYQREILARGQWKTAPPLRDDAGPLVVVDPKDGYLMSDADFAVYDAQCKAARVVAALYVENPDHCPMLVAEDEVRQAERLLVNSLESVTNLGADTLMRSGMKNYHTYVETSLKLMAPFVDRGAIMERVTNPPARAAGTAFERPAM